MDTVFPTRKDLTPKQSPRRMHAITVSEALKKLYSHFTRINCLLPLINNIETLKTKNVFLATFKRIAKACYTISKEIRKNLYIFLCVDKHVHMTFKTITTIDFNIDYVMESHLDNLQEPSQSAPNIDPNDFRDLDDEQTQLLLNLTYSLIEITTSITYMKCIPADHKKTMNAIRREIGFQVKRLLMQHV